MFPSPDFWSRFVVRILTCALLGAMLAGAEAGENTLIAVPVSATLKVPTVEILSPLDGAKYPLDRQTSYTLLRRVTEAPGHPTHTRWEVFLNHQGHEEAKPPILSNSATIAISPLYSPLEKYFYRIRVTVTDDLGVNTSREVRLYPNATNVPPTVGWSLKQARWKPVSPARLLDPGAKVSDVDSPGLEGGELRVTLVGAAADDRLTILPEASTGVTLQSGKVLFNGTIVGAWGGLGSQTLSVRFNEAVTPVIAQAILRRVAATFPGVGTRTVQATVNDGDGDTSATAVLECMVADAAIPLVAFAQPTCRVTEATPLLRLAVNRTGNAALAFNVPYTTVDGSARAGSDFLPTSGTLFFAAGQMAATIVIPLIPDTIREQDETFTVALGTPSTGAITGLPSVTTVTLADAIPAAVSRAQAAAVVDTDVCVYGATSGGVIAAVQAARLGKSVALVSTDTHVGGMSAGGLSNTDMGEVDSIGGMAREFYQRLGARYGVAEQFLFEPHIAEEVFAEMLSEAGVVPFFRQTLSSVKMNGNRLALIKTSGAKTFRAREYIDATYEGDLMAMAGVSFTVGREDAARYGEPHAGVQTEQGLFRFPLPVDPFVTPGNSRSGRLRWIQSGGVGATGNGDDQVQAYNYRLCLTSVPANRLPITAPPNYDEQDYALLARLIQVRLAAGQTPRLRDFLALSALPNGKFDVNNAGAFSTDCVGLSRTYPTAKASVRTVLGVQHRQYVQGLLYYLGHSARVPASVRAEMLNLGLAADEFRGNRGWPHQLYVREARRMISGYVVQEQDCTGMRKAPDPIALGSYHMDTHPCQRLVEQTVPTNEGGVNVEAPWPYGISYRSIVPKTGQCENLLVTFALSASHVAFGSLRMEPVLMMTSQSAATAASQAIDDNVAVQQVSYPKLFHRLTADGQVVHWPPLPFNAVAVDNADIEATTTGTWVGSTSRPGYYGANYVHDGNANKGTSSFRFTPNLTADGDYDVYIRWIASENRATNVPIEVRWATGTATVTVDQTKNDATWVLLGRWKFEQGTGGSVLIKTEGTNGYVVADAVYWNPVGTPFDIMQLSGVPFPGTP